MTQIQQDHAVADETKKIVARDEAAASKKATETQALKDDAQRDLDEALPALEEAVECVKKLKSDHIREVKALSKPPSGVILTMEAVCIMFGVRQGAQAVVFHRRSYSIEVLLVQFPFYCCFL